MITRLRKIDMANIDVTSCAFASKTRYARTAYQIDLSTLPAVGAEQK